VWKAVRERFRLFVQDLQITDLQRSDGISKHFSVGEKLERNYYGGNIHPAPPGLLVGSWGKRTQVRPSADVDSFFILPPSVKSRFDQREGNKQSQLLQEIRAVLSDDYPQTDIRADGQVVVIGFNTITLEIVPAFQSGQGFLIPDTNDGGRWKYVDPYAQIAKIDNSDTAMNGNVRSLSKMIKHWKNENGVPIKSFIIELLVSDFLPQRVMGDQSTFWYDFYVRDFLIELCAKARSSIQIPGTGEFYPLGDAWLSRAQTARDVAIEACYWEYHDYDVTAGQEWQKIFGTRIPIHVM